MRLFIALVVVCAVPSAASAFEVKYTEGGEPIRWIQTTVPFVVDATLDNQPPSVVRAAVTAGFTAWSSVSSSYLELVYDGSVDGLAEGHQQHGENVNLVRFERSHFEYDQAALAVTLLTYEVRTGALVDADIVVNAVDYTFAADSDFDGHDIQNTIAHEAGHFVGLAHEQHDETATMYPVAMPGETAKRSLGEDDEAGISFLYPGEIASVGAGPSADSAGEVAQPAPAQDDGSVTLDRVEVGLDCQQAPSPGGSAVLLLLPILIGVLCRRRGGVCSGARTGAVVIAGALLTVGLPMTSQATTMIALELDDLYSASTVAFVGQVEQTESYWVNGRIVTEATLAVQECLVGACGQVEVVHQIGGQVGPLVQEVVGTRLLAPGDEVVLFARGARDGAALEPVGMSQGIFRLDRDEVTRDLSDVHLVAGGKSVERLASIPGTLGELREAVRLLNSR